MKTRIMSLFVALSLLCLAAPAAWAQFTLPQNQLFLSSGTHGMPEYFRLSQQYHAAAAKYKEAKTEEERQEVRNTIRRELIEEFEKDAVRRKEELQKFQLRLEQLQAALDKRMDNRDKIVDLRLQVVLAEAEDLGWSTGHPNGIFSAHGGPFSAANYGHDHTATHDAFDFPAEPSQDEQRGDGPELFQDFDRR